MDGAGRGHFALISDLGENARAIKREEKPKEMSLAEKAEKYGIVTKTVIWNMGMQAAVSGFAVYSTTVHVVTWLKSVESLQQVLGSLSQTYLEQAGLVVGLAAGLYSAKGKYITEVYRAWINSDESNVSRDNLFRDIRNSIAATWNKFDQSYSSAVRLATLAIFGPSLLKAVYAELPAGSIPQRIFKGIATSFPRMQNIFDRLAGTAAAPIAVFTLASVTVTQILGPHAVQAERGRHISSEATNYIVHYPLQRALWEVPMTISLTHLVLKTLNIPASDSLKEAIKFAAILASVADHLDLPTVDWPRLQIDIGFVAGF